MERILQGGTKQKSHLSASSRTRYVTLFRLVFLASRWSIKRPGVAMTISTPERSMLTCGGVGWGGVNGRDFG